MTQSTSKTLSLPLNSYHLYRKKIPSRTGPRCIKRKRVGSAYDMATEIAPFLSEQMKILDVGCGDGFIAHHLSALLRAPVIGIDILPAVEAPIDYLPFDGKTLPLDSNQFDGALACYVLHHAQDQTMLVNEIHRVLIPSGRLIIYEDIPKSWLDKLLCAKHTRDWESRSGSCHFRQEADWESFWEERGFEVIVKAALSRWRDLSHPVARCLYVLQKVAR